MAAHRGMIPGTATGVLVGVLVFTIMAFRRARRPTRLRVEAPQAI